MDLQNKEFMQLNLQPDVNDYVKETLIPFCESTTDCSEAFTCLLQTLFKPPLYTTVRVNTLKSIDIIQQQLAENVTMQYARKGIPDVTVDVHSSIPDALIVKNIGPQNVVPKGHEVIVGLACGMSVLRGADVYVGGIMGAPHAMQAGDTVSVYADIKGTCLKGRIDSFTEQRMYVGNGIAKFSRADIFQSSEPLSGVGVEMRFPLYICPSLHGLLEDSIFPQNLPSILCPHVLNPQPGEWILDMCAAPGGKTTHIATIMKNTGKVIALDKSKNKVERLKSTIGRFQLTNVDVYKADSTKLLSDIPLPVSPPSGPPPYSPGSFDRILLDAPCSALGQRPSAHNDITLASIKSFPIVQQKLLKQAHELLAPGGTLVYSTCTIVRQENEDQVAWFLNKYPDMELMPQTPHVGGPGLNLGSLSQQQADLLQRFLPMTPSGIKAPLNEPHEDTIGFFCAKFMKNNS